MWSSSPTAPSPRWGQDRIWFADSQTGEEYVYPCDRVVLAWAPPPPAPMPWRTSRPWGPRCSGWGTRPKSGQVWDAVHAGYHAARSL